MDKMKQVTEEVPPQVREAWRKKFHEKFDKDPNWASRDLRFWNNDEAMHEGARAVFALAESRKMAKVANVTTKATTVEATDGEATAGVAKVTTKATVVEATAGVAKVTNKATDGVAKVTTKATDGVAKVTTKATAVEATAGVAKVTTEPRSLLR
ncbi:hypothetical protein TSUD_143260 [Trifolium subterraneum]|uniref:Uncharacterized protein n=1 Tax=Trifolium subterraneum TaxID=3900 RepID=A0A2Z6N5D2_TRISU|nr:hypothetical protein TSUD_143260 [Trifolium subterraneum]